MLPGFPYAEYAKLLGLGGLRIDKPEHVAGAWDEALRAERPMLLQMVTDPNVPPLPPNVTLKQTRSYLKALLHGDPQAAEVVRATMREVWDAIRPKRR